MAAPTATFWYEFASTYSYPAAMRVDQAARARGVAIEWRPLLLGPIFQATGWKSSPFNEMPAKGRYMWRDLERVCAADGLKLTRPDPFPANSLLAARVATALADQTDRAAFSRAVYLAEFADGRPIHDPAVLSELLGDIGVEPETVLAAATSDPVKAALRASVEAAVAAGIFGAPSLTTADGDLFWGNDRLDMGLDHAARLG